MKRVTSQRSARESRQGELERGGRAGPANRKGGKARVSHEKEREVERVFPRVEKKQWR